uniref:TLC domain-containing protein n=1 Tax=Parastrongyloides trichosuri TaxID=131310 RepID=A0A0N5A323_PARTI
MGHESRRILANRIKKPPAPLWSWEFFCQNHGDIMSCILMFIIIGFMFGLTNPISSVFVLPQYNETIISPIDNITTEVVYSYGLYDIPNFLFYTIFWITIHALIQEYIFDKVQRRNHLSRTSMSKFFESGHLVTFFAYSAIHSLVLLYENNYINNPSQMWIDYPKNHKKIGLNMKMFYLLQISYWLHQFPCFLFQRIKRDEMATRGVYSMAYLILIMASYYMNFTKSAVLLMFLQYFVLTFYHYGRVSLLLGKRNRASISFALYNLTFILTKFFSVSVIIFTFGSGLESHRHDEIEEGNYNTSTIRFIILLIMTSMQIFQVMKFFMKIMAIYFDSYDKDKGTLDEDDSNEEGRAKRE